MMRRVTVLLVDSQPLVAAGVAQLLNSVDELDLVGYVATLAEGRDRLVQLHPDLVISSLRLPDGSGLDLLGEAAASGSRTVLLTDTSDAELLRRAYESGVDGILSKRGGAETLLESLLRIAHRQRVIDPEVLDILLRSDDHEELTPRENEIASLAARGLRNSEIAASLRIAEGTVKAHLRKIFSKLGVRNRTQLARRRTGPAKAKQAEEGDTPPE
jgi:two-component system, NarL family, nitrate/nitrite response regulator NarL